MSLTQEIEARIEKFVSELNELVRKQALDAVASALGTGGAPVRRGPGRPPKSAAGNGAAAAVSAPAPKARAAKARKKGEKRTADELAQLEGSLENFVRTNPGQGIEAIGKAIGFATAELARPMKKLVQRGSVRTEGEKRATKYYPSEGGAASASASASAGEAAAPKRRGRPPGKASKKKGKKK
ncbi:DNA-binding protein [Sandaracinus amylolyticus]|uniref:DNA-binding protein n=1 Tax=Sandaracinus amylolyticus TaxID=927083 RepID=UPI001F2CA141|nr:DNA-binding protein [Sandaracinus amylolyticus]UJR80846.1 DNA-binding protein [Sandaracinus amylolyticus]